MDSTGNQKPEYSSQILNVHEQYKYIKWWYLEYKLYIMSDII